MWVLTLVRSVPPSPESHSPCSSLQAEASVQTAGRGLERIRRHGAKTLSTDFLHVPHSNTLESNLKMPRACGLSVTFSHLDKRDKSITFSWETSAWVSLAPLQRCKARSSRADWKDKLASQKLPRSQKESTLGC